jgi:hypothetical protein
MNLNELREEPLFEMANLPPSDTGIDGGFVFISTEMASHGPRVKFFLKLGKAQKSFSVSIEENPKVLVSSLPEKVVKEKSPQVIEWVRLNHQALAKFWQDGTSMTRDEVNKFVEGLKKVTS